MEGDSRTQYYTQDSLAVEMLNKLQNSTGFTTVAVPEGFSMHPTATNPSLQPGAASTLNAAFLNPSVSQASLPGMPSDSVLLSSATGLDSALTQFLVAAQSGNPGVSHSAASSVVSNMPSVLAPSLSATIPSSSAHVLHPVLSASLAPIPPHQSNTEVLVASATAPPAPDPVAGSSSEAMIITVHCTTSDTVVVVGQHNWQCCMCRDAHGFDTSIDQHLATKHNLLLRSSGAAQEELGVAMKKTHLSAGFAESERDAFLESSVKPSSAEPLQTISEQALSSLQNPESVNTRSGLEREVALLMAQTFTHSGSISVDREEANKESSFTVSIGSQEKLKHEPVFADNFDINTTEQATGPKDGEVGNATVYDNMIDKVERAIHSTVDSDAKNDLLLVATELARMQKDLTSKRRQMKKNHRYIRCSECGKEVRNRKDLIRQHNRCHEKTKKYRCLICNKMFKYTHTLRRHVLQQGHKGGMSEELNVNPPQDHDSNDVNVGDIINFEKLVKAEVGEAENDADTFITVDLSSLSPEDNKTVSSDSTASCLVPSVNGVPAYEKIRAMLLSKGELNRTPTGRKLSLLQCFVCDREIRNRNYYITRHARCHLEDLCYTCSVCGLEFYRTDYYREHMTQHGATFENSAETSASDCKEKSSQVQAEEKTETTSGVRQRKIWTPKPATVPCKLCGKSIFNRTYNIKRHAQQHSILEWESILSSSPIGRKSQGKALSGSQLSIHCGVCGLTFKNYTLKRRHMLKHRSSFPCRVCNERFDSGAELVAHSQVCKKAGGSTAQQRANNPGARGPTWRKQVMGQAFGVKKWRCPVCDGSIIHTVQNINRHMRELHSDGQPHNCPKCNRTYSSYHKMQRHLKSHGDTGGICHVCGKVFQTKAALRGHTKLHATPEGMFQCPHCPTSFRFQGRLEKHMRKHAEQTDICPHCGKVYISKVHLQRHISVVHLGVKDYRHKCDQCGAQFFESVQLRDHIAYRHEGVQLYTCKFCHKGFNCRPTMVRHERKEHTNYLPYKCKHCSQGFPEKSKLVAHEMTHTGVSPHKCDICAKYFTTGSALKAHKNLHLGVKPFVCSMCGKTYLKNWHLQQHMRKAHKVLEVMVCDLSGQTQQEQVLAEQPGNQQSMVPSAGTKLLQTAVQGEYIHVHTDEGTNLQQATAHNLIQGHGQITVQHAVVYQ